MQAWTKDRVRDPHEALKRYFDPGLDFPLRAGRPKLRYLLASVPRSGSTAFCLALWRTGILGAPLEYTNPSLNESLIARLGCAGEPRVFWRRLHAVRTSPNGTFGHKIFLPTFLRLAERSPGLSRSLTADRVIYLTRRDRVGQAVSYSRAIRTGVWAIQGRECPRPPIEFDHDHIAYSMRVIEDQQAAWERLFRASGTKPLRVEYEQLLENPDIAVRRVVAFVLGQGSVNSVDDTRIPLLTMQRDKLSEQWRQLFINRPPTPPESHLPR